MVGTLTIPQQLIDEINEKLGKDYPSLEAVRVSRDRIEIREKVQDDIAAAFPVRVAPENVTVKAKTAPKKNPAQEAPKTQTEGFGIEPVTEFAEMLTQEQQIRLREIIDTHQDILTRTKPDSGVWHCTCREIARLKDGTFGTFHRWNPAWIERLYRHGASPRFLAFAEGVPVLDALNKTLDYIQCRWKEGTGTFWWPKEGVRKSLLEFLVARSRDGLETSPFIEVYFWHMTWMGYREALPGPARDLIDTEARKTGYMDDSLVALWSGAAQVVQWYNNNRGELMQDLVNRSRLANSWDLLRLICDWKSAAKFNVHPLLWVRSNTERWNKFKLWAKNVHGVSI